MKEHIAASTGLSSSAQRLMHGNKLLQDSEYCWQYNECNINLCCSLKGGSICDICGAENPELHCKSCDKALCSDCSTLVHRHPQRQNHVIMENNNTCTAMNADTQDSNSQSSTVSDFLDSIYHDDLERQVPGGRASRHFWVDMISRLSTISHQCSTKWQRFPDYSANL